MTHIWKQRPPSFPSDDRIPFSAAEVNEFNDIEDLRIGDNEQAESLEMKDSPPIKSKLSLRARDSIFVRREQARNSVPQIFTDSETGFTNDNHIDDDDDERHPKGVRFSIAGNTAGNDNEGYVDDENGVVLRNKNLRFSNQNFNDPSQLDNFVAFHDLDDNLSKGST